MKRLLELFKTTTAASVLCACLTVIQAPTAQAQLGDAGEILRAGTEDANLLLENYLKPFGAGFGSDLNSGWVNSARPYRTLGFDLRVHVGVALVPGSDQNFNVDQLDFQNLQRVDGPAMSQTAFGEDVPGSVLGVFIHNPYSNQSEEVTRFTMPEGIGYPYVPAPMAQLSVGVVKDTDVTLRYMPTVSFDELNVNLFGIGFKHGLNQWLPGGDVLPVDLSVQMGYTRFNSNFSFDLLPESGPDIYNPYAATIWDSQNAELKANGFTGNFLVGKNFPVISLYGGVGFQTSGMSLKTPGSYPITSFNPDYNPGNTNEENRERRIERIDDPIDLSLDGGNSMQAMAGLRLRLGFLAISGSYTVAKFPVANLGVGFSFR